MRIILIGWVSGNMRSNIAFVGTALTLASSLAYPQQSLAQTSNKPTHEVPTFEVASIRQHQGPLSKVMEFSSSGPHVRFDGYNLRGLIMEAYNLRNFQITMPGINEQQNTNYDIVANAAGLAASTRDEARRMLQSLLVDRFQLKVHFEKRPMPVYLMVLGKDTPKLSPGSQPVTRLHAVKGRNLLLETDNITMNDLANEIWNGFMPDRPVIDRTGLTGAYKLRIEATPEYRIGRNSQPTDISIFTAIQEQLGLKLVPSTAPLDILVVDSAQKPSEN